MENRGLHVPGSRTVHEASTSTDHRGEELPAFACSTGLAGWDARRLRFTTAPVNCLRCLRRGAASASAELTLF
jgi:hypothetical protein